MNATLSVMFLKYLYCDASYALTYSYKLRQLYTNDLKYHNVRTSLLSLNLGESFHFRNFGKAHVITKDVRQFLTVSFNGTYALFLGTSVMREKATSPLEKKRLFYVKFALLCLLADIYVQLVQFHFTVPKIKFDDAQKEFRIRMEALIKVFLKDKHVRLHVPPFKGEQDLLLKWGLNLEYIICLSQFVNMIIEMLR